MIDYLNRNFNKYIEKSKTLRRLLTNHFRYVDKTYYGSSNGYECFIYSTYYTFRIIINLNNYIIDKETGMHKVEIQYYLEHECGGIINEFSDYVVEYSEREIENRILESVNNEIHLFVNNYLNGNIDDYYVADF